MRAWIRALACGCAVRRHPRVLDAGCLAIFFELREIAVQLIKKASNVHLLRTKALTGVGDDGGGEAETLCGLDAGRRAGDAEA